MQNGLKERILERNILKVPELKVTINKLSTKMNTKTKTEQKCAIKKIKVTKEVSSRSSNE